MGVTRVRIGRGEGADGIPGRIVLLDAGRRHGDIRGSLVEVVDRDSEDLLEEQASLVGGTHPDLVAVLRFEVGRGADAQRAAADVEAGVVGITRPRDEGVGVGVAGVGIGRAQGADGGVGGDVFIDARGGEVEGCRSLVGVGDGDGEVLLEEVAIAVLGPDVEAVAGLPFEVGAIADLEHASYDGEVGIVVVTCTRNQGEGVGVTRVGIDRGEGADRGSDGVVLPDAGRGQGDLRGQRGT